MLWILAVVMAVTGFAWIKIRRRRKTSTGQ